MNPLANVRPGDKIQRPRASTTNAIRDATRAHLMSKIRWGVRSGPPALSIAILKITSITVPIDVGGGMYWAHVQKRKSGVPFVANNTNFNMATFYEDANANDVLVLNMLETGLAAETHDIALNKYVFAIPVGSTEDAPPYPVYLTFGFGFAC